MEARHSAFLNDDSSVSHIKSPIKTSTATKESIKWNEEAFFKRQNLARASESLFLPTAESSINALSQTINTPTDLLQKIRFQLNDNSLLSEGANSSLGILHVENFDFSDSSINEPMKFLKKSKPKKKLKRTSPVCYEEKDVQYQTTNVEEKLLDDIADAILSNPSNTSSDAESKNDSSSDFEYDGTNIPELNIDCDMLSLTNSNKAFVTRNNIVNNSNETETNNTGEVSKESSLPESFWHAQNTKDHILSSDNIASRKSSVNVRQSIFEDFRPSLNSLQETILSEKKVDGANKVEKNLQTIKVCPFLDMSSFEVEPILGKKSPCSFYSDVEKTRFNQNLSVDFCPEQISARSSSFRSSGQFESFSCSGNSNFKSVENFSSNAPSTPSLSNEGLEDQVLGGSHLQASRLKVEFESEESKSNIETKDSRFSVKSVNSDAYAASVSESGSEFEDLGFDLNLQRKDTSAFFPSEENWCSRLGISESDFFSSEAAKEVLKKDKELFEKEQMLEFGESSTSNSVGNWSLSNQPETPTPSWLSELSPDKITSGRQFSVGTLFTARSENLGTLSEDTERERPYFGTEVVTPPKDVEPDTAGNRYSVGAFGDSTTKNMRMSALSEVLDEISFSTTDPALFATKIIEKYNPTVLTAKDHTDNHNILNKSTTFQHSTTLCKSETKALSDIDSESESTLIRSASANNLSEHISIDGDCKSVASEAAQSIDNTLNTSVGSSSGRGSIKTSKSDTCSNCCSSSTQEFTRPTSSCSSACNIPLTLDNALSLQYGSMKYLNSCTGTNQNCFHGVLQQAGTSALPCPHGCAHHVLQPNLLTFGAPNSLQSVIQNTLAGQLHLSGHPASCLGIQVPPELHFPDKIALGDSQEMNLTIQNSGNVGCYYKISYVSAYLNGSPIPFEMSGLSYNSTVPSSVDNTTDILLVLAPKYEGRIEVNLKIEAFLNSIGQTLNTSPFATAKTKIQYDVLRPSVTMLSKGKDVLNIGDVVAGSTFVEYVTVTNNCEVSVPLRISLSNYSLDNQIYFGLKEMNRQKHATSGGLRFISPKVLLYRMPASKNESLPSTINIPVVFESISGKIDSTITAAIETPTLSEVLAFIKITADGSNAKLVLKDPNQNPLTLKAYKGATCSHSVTVINVGSLPVVYDIHIDGDNDVLSVSPSTLNLQPNQCFTISVTFTPSTYNSVKGSLLAAAEPHGQVFCVTEIIGQVKPNSVKSHINIPQIPSSKPTRDSTDFACESRRLIECNKKYLAWGGVDIGETSGLKTCIIRNSNQNAVQLKLFIKTGYQEFLLIDDSGKETSMYELTLAAKEEKEISVTFVPKSVVSYSGLLYIKIMSENDPHVFSIALSGYGGKSNLKVLGLPDGEGTGYCLHVDSSDEADIVYKNVVFHNVGYRPAFVKLLITYDSFIQNAVEKQTVVHPSEFVLLENEKKNVVVSMDCLKKNLLSSNEIISVLYGDEIMRQRLRRISKSFSSKNQNLAYNINFSVPYDGEDRVSHDHSYKASAKDECLFYTSLKKLMIHIFYNGQNANFSTMSFGALSEIQESFSNLTLNTTMPKRRLTFESHLTPVKESVTLNEQRLSLPSPFKEDSSAKPATSDFSVSLMSDCLQGLKLDSWTVQPEELAIDAVNKDKRILLKNYSDSDLRFKVECAVDVITVSPVSGTLPANGEIGLRLTLINTNHVKLFEDYHGNIKITCNGKEKNVSVKVFKDCKKNRGESLLPSILSDTLRSGFLGNSYFMDDTLVEQSADVNIENIFNFPKVIDLQRTKQSVLSETILAISNPRENPVTWSIRSSTMLFTQPIDDSIDSTRCAIEFSPTNGVLKSSETNNIVIKFIPGCVAIFSQFFELILVCDNDKQTCSIKVQGESVAEYPSVLESRSGILDKKQAAGMKKRAKAEIFSETEVIKFPVTASGQKSTQSVTIKNHSQKDNKLTVRKPMLPFALKYATLNVKSRKFLHVPVHFKPQKQGCYESEVIFVCENGFELKIKLIGTCSV